MVFRDDNLPVELFLDFEERVRPLAKAVRERQAETELATNPYDGALDARAEVYDIKQEKFVTDVKILDYDPYRAKFLVGKPEINLKSWRSRLFLQLPGESLEELEKEKQVILTRKADSLHYLRVHRLIITDMIKRYDYIKMSDSVLENI